jgi:hypothetical protein
MPTHNPVELIKLLLSACQREDIPVGKTKLVKLLYLMEVECYRSHRERLTDLTWVFLHYGPYPQGFEQLLGDPDIEQLPRSLADGRRFEQVTVSDAPEFHDDRTLTRLADDIVERWGGLQLERLLDYVYFDTEPMLAAVRGQELDFSTVAPAAASAARNIRIDPKRLAQIRKNVSQHVKELGLKTRDCEWDPVAAAAAKVWDEGHLVVRLEGTGRMDPDAGSGR